MTIVLAEQNLASRWRSPTASPSWKRARCASPARPADLQADTRIVHQYLTV